MPQKKEGSLLVPVNSFIGPERKLKLDSPQGGQGVSCKSESSFMVTSTSPTF